MQLGYYEFANHGDLLLLGAIGLFLIARNWWDIIQYGLSRHAAPNAWLAGPGTVRARLAGTVRRLRRHGRALHRPLSHRHA